MASLDSNLAVALSGKLARDRRTAGSPLEVIDNNGVVTLKGVVLSHKARAAVEIALAFPGVLSVINDLEVDDPDATTELGIVLPLPADVGYHN